MKFPIAPLALLAACLFSCIVVLPFYPFEKSDARPFAFEIELASGASGHAQVYYDAGEGFRETDSARLKVGRNEVLAPLRFPLPAMTLRAIRFDPIDRTTRVSFRNARIVGSDGTVLYRFSPSDFVGQQQIAALEIESETVKIETTPRAEDPILRVKFDREVKLPSDRHFGRDVLTRALPVFVGLVLALALIDRLPTAARKRISSMGFRLMERWALKPKRAVALAAFAAVALSSYPVVFLGKSFVSPNFVDGTFLLYDSLPTLPGDTSTATEDARGSDVGAIFWAHTPYSFVHSRALLTDHELPLWNRFNSCGTVLLGQGQSMFGDPLHLPVILANGASWAWDLKFLMAKWLLCFGLGLAVLHGTRHLPSALLAALSAAFLGFFVFRLNHPAYFSFCYAPWILYAWLRLSTATSSRSAVAWCAALMAACVAELHSGTVKEAYMLLLGLNVSGAFIIVFAHRPWRERLRLLAAAAWVGILFTLLTAPTWMTFMDALKRAYTSYNAATAFQLHPSMALGLFDEIFYRPLQSDERVSNPSANFLVLVGVLYFFAAFRHAARSPIARGLAWSALPPAALVFGVIPPQWIVKVPFVANVAHIDNTFSCVLIIQLVVLAGFGWRAAFERLGTQQGRGDLFRLGWGYALLVVPWIAFMHVVHRPTYGDAAVVSLLHWGQRVPVSSFVWASLAVLTAAGLVLLLAIRRAIQQRRLDAASVVLISLSLATILWRHGLHSRPIGPDDYVFTPGARVDFHANSPAIAALRLDQTEPGRAVGLGGNLFPGWSSAYGIEGICGPDALINPYYRDLLDGIGIDRIWDWRIFTTAANLAAQKPVLDFLNVRHYVDLRSDQQELGRLLQPVKMADLDIYRSATAWPRAFFTRQVVVYDSARELGALVRSATPQPFGAVQRNEEQKWSDLVTPVSAVTEPGVPARDYRLTTNSTSFTIDANGPGIAIVHEAWLHREFEATVDGQPARVLRVNHAFKGVAIPAAGTHRVSFTYRPRRFSLALSLAVAGAMLGCVTAAGAWWWPPIWSGSARSGHSSSRERAP